MAGFQVTGDKYQHQIDGDILAFENLLQSILYYDRVFILDDYKQEFKASRSKEFPFIDFIQPKVEEYDALIKEAEKLVQHISPRITGGQFSDPDFASFMDMLQMNVTFTWDLSSSKYFLTLKMLSGGALQDNDKFGELSSAIISQLSNRKVSSPIKITAPELIDSHGNPIGTAYTIKDKEGHRRETGLTTQTEMFFSALSWLAVRTVVYSMISADLKADLFLHPIRNAFSVKYLSKHSKQEAFFKPILDSITKEMRDTFSDITKPTQPIFSSSQTPLYVAWIASKTKEPHNFIEKAFSLRDEKEFVMARSLFADLEKIIEDEKDFSKFTKEANKILLQIQKESKCIRNKYTLSSGQGELTGSMVFLWNLLASVKGWIKIPGGSIADITQLVGKVRGRSGFNAVYHNLLADLTSVERLGKLHEVITSRVKITDDAHNAPAKIKKEDLKFAKMKSNWKVPM